MAAYAAYAVLKSATTPAETGAMIAPLMTQLVWTTDAARPEEPTSPVIVASVQVTAPPPPGAALRTANDAAVPSDDGSTTANAGPAPQSSAAVASKHGERYFRRSFMVGYPFRGFFQETRRNPLRACIPIGRPVSK